MDRAYAGIPTYMDDITFTMLDRHGCPEETHFAFSYTPARDEDGRVAGMFCVCTETTAQVLSGRRLQLLFDLGDELRRLSTPAEIMATAAAAVGLHLGAGRVGYGSLDASEDVLTVERDWTDGIMPSFAGRWRLDDFGPIVSDLRAGQPVRLNDSLADPRTEGREDLFSAATLRAAIAVPLIRDGSLSAVMYVHQAAPRHWHAEDEALVRTVAERTWDALERTTAEAALRDLNNTLEREIEERTAERDRLWSLSEDLLMVAGYDGQLLRVSPSWSRVLGYDEATLLATPYPDLLHPDDAGAFIDSLRAMQAHERPVRVEGRVRAADGTSRWIAWTLSPDPGGAQLHGVGRDVEEERLALEELAATNRQLVLQIEERERVEATLRQMQRLEAIGQLTSGVAHDFNNLLTVILGNISALTRVLQGPDEQRRLEMMRAAAARGAKLTGQLLAFSRNLRLEPKAIDLNETVAGMRDLIRSTLGVTVELELHLQPDLWSALVDPTQIELVILNLAINARDAMDEAGTLTIGTANARITGIPARQEEPGPGEYVMIAIADTGSGMSDDILDKAFEPFFTTKEVGKGSGLGLSQVLGFAKQSGGGVRVKTRTGAGTTVEVYLPKAAAPAETAGPRATAPLAGRSADGRRPTVLLVDDDAGVREVASFMLDELGYDVIEAGSGGAALDQLDRDHPVDLLLVDFAMPGMNGAELAREARAKRPALPVVFVTGYADFTALRHVSHEHIVQKPLDEEELGSKLRAALDAVGHPHV
jgi:PAS domain S-box-containing protein